MGHLRRSQVVRLTHLHSKLTVLGLIITISLLCAAGLAIYEHPQVRQWIDESRRKAAIALHSLGDEVAPQSEARNSSPDASTREDDDPEAIERRRRARQEILERGRKLEERRKSKQAANGRAKSFDEMVDKDGTLKVEEKFEEPTATSSAAKANQEESGLRHRHTESRAAALGSVYANPFADEMAVPIVDAHPSPQEQKPDSIPRSSTPTLPISSDSPPTLRDSPASPPVPPKPAAYQPQRPLIDTDEVSNHPSEQLVDLTPTTSASSAAVDLAELNDYPQLARSNHWSAVNEWTQNNAPAFYSPPQSEAAGRVEERMESHLDGSQAETGEHASQIGSEDMDFMSDEEARITPGSWTEVGSQVSEDY